MAIAESLLPEFDQEMSGTRKVIELVPDGKPDWRPHPRSMPLGYMAVHLATLPNWVNMILEKDELDIGAAVAGGWKMPDFSSTAATVADFDRNIASARALLAKATDAELVKPWTLKNNGTNVFTLPKVATIRSMVFNHIIHHRAQLTVYLRLNDIPLPSLYGPTADVPM